MADTDNAAIAVRLTILLIRMRMPTPTSDVPVHVDLIVAHLSEMRTRLRRDSQSGLCLVPEQQVGRRFCKLIQKLSNTERVLIRRNVADVIVSAIGQRQKRFWSDRCVVEVLSVIAGD